MQAYSEPEMVPLTRALINSLMVHLAGSENRPEKNENSGKGLTSALWSFLTKAAFRVYAWHSGV
jgi:hypothetical protein